MEDVSSSSLSEKDVTDVVTGQPLSGAVMPWAPAPVDGTSTAVVNVASKEGKGAARATPSIVPMRCSGLGARAVLLERRPGCVFVMLATPERLPLGVLMKPGAMEFTRIPAE